MSKSEEIKILTAAAKKLGNDSYLGPSLLDLTAYLECELRSDICPDLLGLIRDMESKAATLAQYNSKLSKEVDVRAEKMAEMDRELARKRRELESINSEIYMAEEKARSAINLLRSYIN